MLQLGRTLSAWRQAGQKQLSQTRIRQVVLAFSTKNYRMRAGLKPSSQTRIRQVVFAFSTKNHRMRAGQKPSSQTRIRQVVFAYSTKNYRMRAGQKQSSQTRIRQVVFVFTSKIYRSYMSTGQVLDRTEAVIRRCKSSLGFVLEATGTVPYRTSAGQNPSKLSLKYLLRCRRWASVGVLREYI